MDNKNFSPMIYDYLKKYQEDPTSRVFAPLAEAYRKAGLIDEAIEIAREGLRVHPNFVGGRVALIPWVICKSRISPGSRDPLRVAIIGPSTGVKPIVVSSDWPSRTAVTEHPLPR